jgi:hypothetical protein
MTNSHWACNAGSVPIGHQPNEAVRDAAYSLTAKTGNNPTTKENEMTNQFKWGRSEGGYVKSACGRFRISPLFCGADRPQFYQLIDTATGAKYHANTQRAAKETAEQVPKWNEQYL